MVASSKNTSTRRRSIFVSIDASSIVSNHRSSIDARARARAIARGTIARRDRIRIVRRRTARRGFADAQAAMAKKNVKAGMNARKDALVDMQTVSARQTTVRECADPYEKPLVGDDDDGESRTND